MKHVLSILFIFFIAAYTCNRVTMPFVDYEVKGIDVSHYQSIINWDTVASNDINFAFVKATEGVSLNDSLFANNWMEIQRVGIRRGAYHFYRPTYPAAEQADNFINSVRLEVGDMPPVLDIEVLDGVSKIDLISGLYTWLYKIEIAYGIKPIIYTNQKFYNHYLSGHFEEYPLWIARYSSREPKLWDGRQWDFWQYGSEGKLKGIEGNVDFNVFSNTYTQLEALCVKPSTVRRGSPPFPVRNL